MRKKDKRTKLIEAPLVTTHDPLVAPSERDTDEMYITILETDKTSSFYTCKLEAKKDAQARRQMEWILRNARLEQEYVPTPEDDDASDEYLAIRRRMQFIVIG